MRGCLVLTIKDALVHMVSKLRHTSPRLYTRATMGPCWHGLYAAVMCLLLGAFGCTSKIEDAVVISAATDREYAEPILEAFARRHPGTELVRQYLAETNRTVALSQLIENQSQAPQADVLWNDEILQTLRLENAGLLQRISWSIPSDWPRHLRSSQGKWLGFASRARVLLINRELLPEANSRPNSVLDLADPQWQDRCGVALPLAGTAATHFTILRNRMGAAQADVWFQKVSENALVLPTDRQVARAVSAGRLAFGLTDSDDALVELDAGGPVEIVFPDQRPDQSGALRIPNTVAVLANCAHPVAAAELANYLVSPDTEGRLAMGVSGQFPARPGHSQASRAQGDALVRWMEVDFVSAAQEWDTAAVKLHAIFGKAAAE